MQQQMTKNKMENENKKHNVMRNIKIDKMVLNCGGIDEKFEKSIKLLEMITGKKVLEIQSTRRIPAFGISPGKKSGCKVTLRNVEEIKTLLRRFFAALDNKITASKITENHLSFGIREYIEVPGLEYKREIGMLGFEVSLVFTRAGRRTKLRKRRTEKYPKKQAVTREEIIKFLHENFKLEVEE